MATTTISYQDNSANPTNAKSTWQFKLSMNDIVVGESKYITVPSPSSFQTTYSAYSGKTHSEIHINIALYATGVGTQLAYFGYDGGPATHTGGSWRTVSVSTSSSGKMVSYWFNVNNPTQRVIPVYAEYQKVICTAGKYEYAYGSYVFNTPWGEALYFDNRQASGACNLILNAPPTAQIGEIEFSTLYGCYKGVTTVSVSVNDMEAYYGGDFASEHSAGAVLEIGNQTSNTIHSDGTLQLVPNSIGEFTPKVTVTDSRGQTYVKTLDPITVQEYIATATIDNVARIDAVGEPHGQPTPGHIDDEGTNAVVAATFNYPAENYNYMLAPTVKINRQLPQNNIEWYEEWDPNSGFSDIISFNNYQPSLPVTLYGRITDELSTDTSYNVSVACNSTMGSGSESSDIIPQAFYLLSAKAGGHGIGIGAKAKTDDFYVNMNSYFYRNIMAHDMAGMIRMHGGAISQTVVGGIAETTGAPRGWLLCDGSAVSREAYEELFDAIGTSFGQGDGSTTFNLPDLRDRIPLGISSQAALNAQGGDKHIQAHTHSRDAAKTSGSDGSVSGTPLTHSAHTHYLSGNDKTYNKGSSYMRIRGYGQGSGSHYTTNSSGNHYHNIPDHNHAVTGGDPGNVSGVTANNSGNANEGNMPPYIGIGFIIATGRVDDIITHEI